MDDLPPGNIPEFSVSDISGAVKRTLEGAFARVRVRGEITELRRPASGHVYFALKDERAKLAAVAWRGQALRLGLKPEEGVEVIATGRITTFGERSAYQLTVERLEYAGAGAMLARIEALRLALAAEGLFEAARKRALPLLPEVVGVVTSPQGAVLHDIRTTLERRFPRRVLVWPVPVQGEGAAERIAAAIAGFGRLPQGGAVPRPDVLIVARGGGSLEDLMAFNDEAVVRAAAASPIPLISAVGHETDTTLIDHAADRRAPTPTAAAELAVPSRAELAASLAQGGARLAGALHRRAQASRLRLDRASGRLPDLPGLLAQGTQRLDDRAQRLALALPNLLAARRAALVRAERGLPEPHGLLRGLRARVGQETARLVLALPNLLAARRAALVRAERHMPAPGAVLASARTRLGLAAPALRAALRHGIAHRRQTAARVLPRLSPAPLAASLRERRARLDGLAARLEGVSPLAVLARGYALVSDAAGRPVTSARAVRPGARLTLAFADGRVVATAERQGSLGL